ncbi:hypothetical protein QM012_000955 [Aureobasidium pullulans]|uniref:BZIP domain-containing protein n=1 Tax=Aureobasidium pullulans TaxID=5580 RepID=A0ABR0TGR5_AURPU
MDVQKSRELKRKAQLRDAQRRLRQRKMDELKDANTEIQALRKQLTEAKEVIVRLDAATKISMSNNVNAPIPASHQPAVDHHHDTPAAHNMDAQADFEEFVIGGAALGQPWTPVSASTLESFFPESSNDMLSLDMANAFHFPQHNGLSNHSSPTEVTSQSSDQESAQIWPLGYTAVLDDHVPYLPLSAHSDTPSNPPAQLVRQLNPAIHSPARESTFAKRLWRRCAEMALRMLADTKRHQAGLERAFGAYLHQVTPEKIRRSLTSALGEENFGELEYHTYPKFDFGFRSRMVQGQMAENLLDPRRYDSEDDPYMTPRDVENYFVLNGQLRQSVDPKGNIVTLPCHFDYQGNRWILEEKKLIHILMQFAVCLGQGPALLASHVIAATFQSMQRVKT